MRPGTSTRDVLGVPRASDSAGTAHTRPYRASVACCLTSAYSCSNAVATARGGHARRHDDFDMSARPSTAVCKRAARSNGSPACSQRGRKKIMSIGQRSRRGSRDEDMPCGGRSRRPWRTSYAFGTYFHGLRGGLSRRAPPAVACRIWRLRPPRAFGAVVGSLHQEGADEQRQPAPVRCSGRVRRHSSRIF